MQFLLVVDALFLILRFIQLQYSLVHDIITVFYIQFYQILH